MSKFPTSDELNESNRYAREAKEILDHKERRDRFAIAALPFSLSVVLASDTPEEDLNRNAARVAYGIADAMIAERDQ